LTSRPGYPLRYHDARRSFGNSPYGAISSPRITSVPSIPGLSVAWEHFSSDAKNQDDLVEKMDETKNEIVGEIRDLRSDPKSILEDWLSRIDSYVIRIKAKIGL
jgi:hypothetical protein